MTLAVPGLAIVPVESPEQLTQVRELFLEYAKSLNFSLCFQSFEKELADLPGDYAPPEGRLLLAYLEGEAAGCVALHKLEAGVCEMKRLYLRPRFRGKKVGFSLATTLIGEARQIRYRAMRLDTVTGTMDEAIGIYRRLGFSEIAAYRPNPIPGALYMELSL